MKNYQNSQSISLNRLAATSRLSDVREKKKNKITVNLQRVRRLLKRSWAHTKTVILCTSSLHYAPHCHLSGEFDNSSTNFLPPLTAPLIHFYKCYTALSGDEIKGASAHLCVHKSGVAKKHIFIESRLDAVTVARCNISSRL